MDYLIITGPVNAAQLHVPKDASYKVIQVHPKGKDIGSNAMQAAMAEWLGGKPIRSRLPEDAGKVGVIWFSAGHGSVRSILKTSAPGDVDAWLCIDGLYGDNRLAVDIIEACKRGETSLLATAGTSTPGPYDHSLGRWRDAVAKTSLPEIPPEIASAALLPTPDFAWGVPGCFVAGYSNLGHHDQVPSTRVAFMARWDSVRTAREEPVAPGEPPPPGSQPAVDSSREFPTITVAIMLAALAGGMWLWHSTSNRSR